MRGVGRLMLCLLLVSELCRFPFEMITKIQVGFIGGLVAGLLFSDLMLKITRNVIRYLKRET